MLKFLLNGKGGRKVIGLGLELGNVTNLQRQLPIIVHGEELGVANVDVLVCYGHTQAALRSYIEGELRLAIDDRTEVRGDSSPPAMSLLFDDLLVHVRERGRLEGWEQSKTDELVALYEDRFARAVAH